MFHEIAIGGVVVEAVEFAVAAHPAAVLDGWAPRPVHPIRSQSAVIRVALRLPVTSSCSTPLISKNL